MQDLFPENYPSIFDFIYFPNTFVQVNDGKWDETIHVKVILDKS